MEHINNFKLTLSTALGIVGGFISSLFGGWDTALQTLVIFMTVDYISGLILAGVFKKSNKTESGALDSKVGWKGLCKKGMALLIVLIAARLDILTSSTFFRDAAVIGYCVNELISIIENAGLMGVPIPNAIKKAIDTLTTMKGKGDV